MSIGSKDMILQYWFIVESAQEETIKSMRLYRDLGKSCIILF